MVGGRFIQISVACRINSQHQTRKISADSCWVPPGESTMIHQFWQTWHEHAWQSIDNILSIKTAYIIKRVCNQVTSSLQIDLTYQTMRLKQAWPQVNQMICGSFTRNDLSSQSMIGVPRCVSVKLDRLVSAATCGLHWRNEQFLDLSYTSCISMNPVVSMHTHLSHIHRTEYHHKTIVCTFMYFCKVYMLHWQYHTTTIFCGLKSVQNELHYLYISKEIQQEWSHRTLLANESCYPFNVWITWSSHHWPWQRNGAGKAGGMAWRATKQGANAHSTSPMRKPQFGYRRDKMKTDYNVL